MLQTIIEYILIILIIAGLAYVGYLLKDKKVMKEDYFGIADSILSVLISSEATPENIKAILRIVYDAVTFVETNFLNEDNSVKEEKALALIKDGLAKLNLKSNITDDTIKELISLVCAVLPSKAIKNAAD